MSHGPWPDCADVRDPSEVQKIGFGKRGLLSLEKGSQKSQFSRDSRDLDLEISENPQTGKQTSSRDSRECRDRDSSNEKTPFVMTPFSDPEWYFSARKTSGQVFVPFSYDVHRTSENRLDSKAQAIWWLPSKSRDSVAVTNKNQETHMAL